MVQTKEELIPALFRLSLLHIPQDFGVFGVPADTVLAFIKDLSHG